ncbi:MAG: HAMP domain-containing histidine kinase [Lentisphaerae bacterium]|nr:HAMP domain-containing histidine kinase [Lentisphaerota bacterium]
MKRPWYTWLLFLVCLGVVLSAMAWVSANVLRLERANAEVQRAAAREEVVRIALWRMDSAISPMVIQESARPYFEYVAFNDAGTVYPNLLDREARDELVPSPLLLQAPSNVLVYFNGVYREGKQGTEINSPQVPAPPLTELAEDNYDIAPLIRKNSARLEELLADVSLDDVRTALARAAAEDRGALTGDDRDAQIALNQPAQQRTSVQQALMQVAQYGRNAAEFSVRKGQASKAKSKVSSWNKQRNTVSNLRSQQQTEEQGKGQQILDVQSDQAGGQGGRDVHEGSMRPVWVNGMLLLGRIVRVNGTEHVQGAWLDWDSIRDELLREIEDILPGARLFAVNDTDESPESRMMAALPVRIVPGIPAGLPPVIGSPLKLPLVLAWACVLLAAGAVAFLLVGIVSLSERRGAFVSAVTHELRTPLTTFRMYSEMLADGMVEGEEKQREYLRTLCSEGGRLSHLVENVLSYARLEKGRHTAHVERVSAHDVLQRVLERFSRRAEEAGMQLVLEDTADMGTGAECRADVSALEQVLFNLVDNACKYAVVAEDKRIHLGLRVRGSRVVFRVRDHGPGIAREEIHRLFRPFRKSAKHAAETAPGVGLGLSLSRKLARQMRGDLRVDTSVKDGACFDLIIPGR